MTTPLEVALVVAVVVLLVAVALLGVWASDGRTECKKALRRAAREHRDRLADLEEQLESCGAAVERARLQYRIECVRCKVAQERAAEEFVKGQQQPRLGLSFTTGNAGVAGVMRSLQGIMDQMQHMTCATTRDLFLQQKSEFIAQLKQQEQQVSCAEMSKALDDSLPALEAWLREQVPPTIDVQKLVLEIKNAWVQVSTQVCDKRGVVDIGMLDAFMTAMYDAVCKR